MNKNLTERRSPDEFFLKEKRAIFLTGEINDNTALDIISKIQYLEYLDDEEDISIYINSPGGSVISMLAIYDEMKRCRCDIATYCFGVAYSAAGFLLLSGTTGKRFISPNGEVMLHQIIGGVGGQYSDVEIGYIHIRNLKERVNQIIAEHTGKDIQTIENDCNRDYFMSADEAISYGVVDYTY